ncbi:MAG: hypothetical protein C4297_11790 [Gemmataceae bacterium]
MVCRHCHESVVSRPRGLCWRCYYTPGVREQYAPKGFTQRLAIGFRDPPLPEKPTRARPGSRAKIRVLAKRAARGVQLWHPLDVRLEDLPD